MPNNKHNILIVGVGGQGVLLASEIISAVAMNAGLDVKKSEVHGMSQRGGVVSSHVKIAERVYSPTIAYGEADVLMSFEQAEALRAIDWMSKDGIAIVSRTTLVPAIVTSTKGMTYPYDAVEQMQRKVKRLAPVAADKIAGDLGNPRVVNTILLGVLSNYLPFKEEQWIKAMKAQIKPKLVDINLAAFAKGRAIPVVS